jgi:hypothetical protein
LLADSAVENQDNPRINMLRKIALSLEPKERRSREVAWPFDPYSSSSASIEAVCVGEWQSTDWFTLKLCWDEA